MNCHSFRHFTGLEGDIYTLCCLAGQPDALYPHSLHPLGGGFHRVAPWGEAGEAIESFRARYTLSPALGLVLNQRHLRRGNNCSGRVFDSALNHAAELCQRNLGVKPTNKQHHSSERLVLHVSSSISRKHPLERQRHARCRFPKDGSDAAFEMRS